jgi:hypothetical protein
MVILDLDELGVPPGIGNPECTASQTPVEVGAKGSRYVLEIERYR